MCTYVCLCLSAMYAALNPSVRATLHPILRTRQCADRDPNAKAHSASKLVRISAHARRIALLRPRHRRLCVSRRSIERVCGSMSNYVYTGRSAPERAMALVDLSICFLHTGRHPITRFPFQCSTRKRDAMDTRKHDSVCAPHSHMPSEGCLNRPQLELRKIRR